MKINELLRDLEVLKSSCKNAGDFESYNNLYNFLKSIPQEIKIVEDVPGEWCQMWVDGKLVEEAHHERTHWYENILEKIGVNQTYEEKCLDPCHSDCEFPKIPVSLIDGQRSDGRYSVYKFPAGEFLGYVDSEFSYCLEYDKNIKKIAPEKQSLIEIKEVIE